MQVIDVRNRAAALLAMALLGGCAGSGAGLDANGQPLVPGAQGAGPLSANFDSIQANIFTPICTVCHAGAAAPQGLRLDAANSYNLLVGVPSTEVPSLLRVKPGDPSSSYIIQKLEGHAAVGARMPFGGPYLSNEEISTIAQWITDGAAREGTAAAPNSMTLVARAPAPQEILSAAPPQIMLAFSRELDATRVDAGSVHLERLESGAQAAAQVAVRIEVPAANPRALLLTPLQPLARGRYRVTVSTQGPRAVLDLAGLPLQAPSSETEAAAEGMDAVLTSFEIDAGAP